MIAPSTSAIPNPGSDEARRMGCQCPVIDNGHGRGWMGGIKNKVTGETIFIYSVGCPVHYPRGTTHAE